MYKKNWKNILELKNLSLENASKTIQLIIRYDSKQILYISTLNSILAHHLYYFYYYPNSNSKNLKGMKKICSPIFNSDFIRDYYRSI